MGSRERNTATLARSDEDVLVVPAASSRELLDQVPAFLWTTDSLLRFTSSLGRVLLLLGLGPNQIVGTSVSDFLEPYDPDLQLMAAHRRALDGETVECEINWGEERLDARIAPLRDALGRVIGTVGVALERAA
jgi:PAS domain-containing protein